MDLTTVLKVRADLPQPEPAEVDGTGLLVTHLNPPELLRLLDEVGPDLLRNKRHVGYWAWELPTAPPSWRPAFRYVDEVWCPSTFTAAALEALAPAGVTVRVVPHPIFALPAASGSAEGYWPERAECRALASFDLRSTVARKNPDGLLTAWTRAFPEAAPARVLLCKVTGVAVEADRFEALKARVAHRSDIVFETAGLTEPEMTALVSSADMLVSLHRAEGFGLLPASGMWLGKSVVATAWSGNMDYMDAASAALVGWRPEPVQDAQGLYSGAFWAEPDLDEAARLLRNLATDAEARRSLGLRAHAHARSVFTEAKWAADVLRPPP